jgi:DNA-directed RNA polymerase subunit RPC12/RpoP
MDEIEFLCSHCGATLSADPADSGAECECPQCGRTQLIPEPVPVLGTPVAAVSPSGKKKILISGSLNTARNAYPEVADDTPIGRVFRFLAAVLGLAGLGGLALGLFWVTEAGKPHPPWLDQLVDVAPLVLAGLIAIIVARVAFIVGSLAVRYDR